MADRADAARRSRQDVVGQVGRPGGQEVPGDQGGADRPCTRVGGVISPSGLDDRCAIAADEAREAIVPRGECGGRVAVVGLRWVPGHESREGLLADRPDPRRRGCKAVVRDQPTARASEVTDPQGRGDRPRARVGGVVGPGRLVDREAFGPDQARETIVARSEGRRCRTIVGLGRRPGDRDREGLLGDRPGTAGGDRKRVVGQARAASYREVACCQGGGHRAGTSVGGVIGPRGLADGGALAWDKAGKAVAGGRQVRQCRAVVGLRRVARDRDGKGLGRDCARTGRRDRQEVVG